MSGALGELEAAVDAVMLDPLLSLSAAEVAAQTGRLHVVLQRLSGRFAGLVGRAVDVGVARQAGAATAAAWLTGAFAMSGPQAHRWVKLASLLRVTPTVAQALAAGNVSADQAQVIAQTIKDLPSDIGDACRQDAAERLTKLAIGERLAPEVLARHRQEILEQIDPEGAEERLLKDLERRERSAHDRRSLTLSPSGEGEYRLRGTLSAEAAAVVRAALDPLCAPSHRDPNTAATADADEAARAGAAFGMSGAADGSGDAAVGDKRSAGARRADALVEICRRALDAGELPENGGEKPHLVITMSWEQLRDQAGAGLLDTGDLLTPETVRRLACDAQLIPAVLNGDGQVLDLGRARRLIDGPLRRALVLRDKGCAWPGCDRPARWCHGHHIVPWSQGGRTSLDSSVLVCGFHHQEVHKGWWEVRIAADGHPEFIPPTYIDPQRRPQRNTIHRR